MECDIVVLGATGFTGQLVVEWLARSREEVTWLLTGRSTAKIRELVDRFKEKGVDISQVPSLVVDVSARESLVSALRAARLVLNCVGPSTTCSEPVVDACIATRTHYVDMSAEINHILNLYRKYHKAAEEANVLIVPSCAFDSLVAVSGYLYLKDLFHGTLKQVECYTDMGIPKLSYIPFVGSVASYGTWDSMVHVMRNLKEYHRLKAQTFPALELPKDMQRNYFHWRRRSLWFPYPGPEEDVMEFSEIYLHEKRQKQHTFFKLYIKLPLLIHYVIIPAMFLYIYLSIFDWFANLLRRYPRIFTFGYVSQKGPSEKMRKCTSYNFSYIGKGWDKTEDLSKPPNKKVKVKVSSVDPYGSSAVLMTIAAITILKEPSKVPSGGVVNAGAAFYDTTIVERLRNTGITYEVIPNT